MTLYIYNTDTMELVCTVSGGTQEAQDRWAYGTYDTDYYGWTYTPAFGTTDGLIDNPDARRVEL